MLVRLTIAAAALASVAAPALALSPDAANEARIRQIGARLETVPDPGQGIYIRDYRGHWFYARTEGACPRLRFNARTRLIASPGGYFDRNSAIVADGWRCHVASVTISDAPPRRRHH